MKNWREKINEHFIDEDGNYRLGLQNSMTPQMLIEGIGLYYNESTAAGREIINRARIELNAFCKFMTNQGYCAGSQGREPSVYFIAQSKAEKKMILKKSVKQLNGRLEMFKKRGNDLLELDEIKKISKTQKLIEQFEPRKIM